MPIPVAAILAALPIVLPAVVSVVQAVEGLFGGGQGDAKRDLAVKMVLEMLEAYEGVTDKDIVDEIALTDQLGTVIDGVVGVLNEAGVLKS